MHPVLFAIGPISVYSYGFMLALGVAISLPFIKRAAARAGYNADLVIDAMFIVLFSGLFGARIAYVILHISEFYPTNIIGIVKIWEGGLVLYGGVFFGFLSLIVTARIKKIPWPALTDIFIPFLALTQAFGRVGCFLNGCCWGKPAHGWYAVSFPFLEQPVHPTQLYSTGMCLILFIVLLAVEKKKKFTGETSLVYFMLYPVGRFIVELFRGDQMTYLFSLTRPQIVSVVCFFTAGIIFLCLRRRHRE